MPIPDLDIANKDMSRSCVFDFPDRPVRPEPPIDPTGGPPDEYPYNPVWDLPPLDPHPVDDPDDPNKGEPPDPSQVSSTHWLHIFRVSPDLSLYTFHGNPPHEIWMYRQIGLSGGARIGKMVCRRNVPEITPTELSGAPITFWDKPRKTDFETYTPLTADGVSSLNPAGQHVMFYWFLFHFTYVDEGELQNWSMSLPGGFEPNILDGNDSQTHPATNFWMSVALTGAQVIGGSHAVMVRNTKHTDVSVSVSVS